MRTSRGLKWENKTYKLKRSIAWPYVTKIPSLRLTVFQRKSNPCPEYIQSCIHVDFHMVSAAGFRTTIHMRVALSAKQRTTISEKNMW